MSLRCGWFIWESKESVFLSVCLSVRLSVCLDDGVQWGRWENPSGNKKRRLRERRLNRLRTEANNCSQTVAKLLWTFRGYKTIHANATRTEHVWKDTRQKKTSDEKEVYNYCTVPIKQTLPCPCVWGGGEGGLRKNSRKWTMSGEVWLTWCVCFES